ncbi:protein containing Urease alpha-subunit, partial [Candidatus Thiomargarita nelsonii]
MAKSTEVKFGGGKVIRDGMGQSQRSREHNAIKLRATTRDCPYKGPH